MAVLCGVTPPARLALAKGQRFELKLTLATMERGDRESRVAVRELGHSELASSTMAIVVVVTMVTTMARGALPMLKQQS
jgi:hypothetical protein